MEQKKIFKCFVASPGDTAAEREVCEKIFADINIGIGRAYGFELKSLKWESDVHPGIGDDAQDVINRQIADEYDLFIGIMYTRFGSPTNRAESGTVEEFNRAYETALKRKNLEIMFYFNDQSINPSKIDLTQYQKVRDFRDNVVAKNCMYWVYDGLRDFESQVRKHLNQYFNDFFSSSNCCAEKLTRAQFVLEERLNKALKLFSGQPHIWIEPIISTQREISISPDENTSSTVNISDIIVRPSSMIVFS